MDIRNKYHAAIISLFLLSLFMIMLTTTKLVYAKGELMVAPTRIVFDKRGRSAKVNLINTGTEAATYRIQIVNKRMTKDGRFIEVKQALPGELFVNKMLRYSPRQITLPPRKAQVIRLILRKPANLANGEYRSHLLFRSIPTAINNEQVVATKKMKIRLIPLLGITIPVIVRHGETSAKVKINDLSFQAGEKPGASFKLVRSGNQSVYGDLTASFTDSQGNITILGKANGVAVYSPNTIRLMKFALQAPDGFNIKNGKLTISFHDNKQTGGELLSEKSIVIP